MAGGTATSVQTCMIGVLPDVEVHDHPAVSGGGREEKRYWPETKCCAVPPAAPYVCTIGRLGCLQVVVSDHGRLAVAPGGTWLQQTFA
jgi:hypothetical protein